MSASDVRLKRPEISEIYEPEEAELAAWFDAPPFGPADDSLWQQLTPQKARDISRFTGYLGHLFDSGGPWFSASRDQAKYINAFRRHVLEFGESSDLVIVLHRECHPYSGVFTTLGGFLDCWERLSEDGIGYAVFPLDLSYRLRVVGTGTAHIVRRAV